MAKREPTIHFTVNSYKNTREKELAFIKAFFQHSDIFTKTLFPDFTQHINQEKILYHKLNMQHSKIHCDIPSSEGYSGFPHAVNAKLCPKKRFASVNGRGNKPN